MRGQDVVREGMSSWVPGVQIYRWLLQGCREAKDEHNCNNLKQLLLQTK